MIPDNSRPITTPMPISPRPQSPLLHYDFDSQSVRPYLPYNQVKKGIMDTAATLFHVSFRQEVNVPAWHPSVDTWRHAWCVLSGACKREKLSDIARIGRLQGIDIAPPKVAGAHQIRAAPGKDGAALSLGQHIRYQTGVASVAVGKGMDQNQTVMKAHSQFIGRIGLVFHPIARVAEQGTQSLSDLMMWNTNIFLCGSIHPGPPPGLIEHTQMKISHVGLGQRITSAKMVWRQCPRICFENVLAFPLVQLFLGREIGDQICLLSGRQRRVAPSVREQSHRTPRFLSSRLVSASTASSTRPTA